MSVQTFTALACKTLQKSRIRSCECCTKFECAAADVNKKGEPTTMAELQQ